MATDTNLSPWDRALIAARWCRDKAAGFLASFWLYVILWAVVAIAFTVLLYIDGKFSRGLAEGLEEIDPFSFQAMGWSYRLFAAVFLMAAARCLYKEVKGALTFRLLGVFASVIVCLHAFGFGFQALSDRRDDALAQREVVQLQADNSAEQIALLNGQIDRIRSDRDAQVRRLQASIDGIVSDGLNNDHLADVYRADQTRVEEAAGASVAALEAKITALATQGNEARQSVTTTLAEAKPWPALYVGLAQLATFSKEPADWAIYLCGVGFIVGWVLLAESLVIFLPERIYLMHLRDADRAPDVRYSDDLPEGMRRWEGSVEDWNEIEEALKAHKKRKRQSEDKAPAGSPLRLDDKGWKRDMKKRIQDAYDQGMSPQEIADEVGLTWHEYENIVVRMFNEKARAKYLGQPSGSEPDPRAATPPVAEEPQPESDDTPKDYPVEPYKNGADNDLPNQ